MVSLKYLKSFSGRKLGGDKEIEDNSNEIPVEPTAPKKQEKFRRGSSVASRNAPDSAENAAKLVADDDNVSSPPPKKDRFRRGSGVACVEVPSRDSKKNLRRDSSVACRNVPKKEQDASLIAAANAAQEEDDDFSV